MAKQKPVIELSKELKQIIRIIQAQRRQHEKERKQNDKHAVFSAKTSVNDGLIAYVLQKERIGGMIAALNELEYKINPNYQA